MGPDIFTIFAVEVLTAYIIFITVSIIKYVIVNNRRNKVERERLGNLGLDNREQTKRY